ncbi:MAG TPA: ethanolamine ammonia-lyase subunit EutC [Rhodocyclaceae bacterium]
MSRSRSIRPDPWRALRTLTPARIALGRVGSALPTAEVLRFGVAHAQARDAVHEAFDCDRLARDLQTLDRTPLHVHSRAPDRATFLLRPDLGRRLRTEDADSLRRHARAGGLCLVLGDGLSARAVHAHAPPLIAEFLRLVADRFAPVTTVIAEQARVALGDEIGACLGSAIVAVLIGERPGLSSPDSLGIYLTFAPHVGRNDAERNCLSNIRAEGMPPAKAARRLLWLVDAASRLQLTGVGLKDDSDAAHQTRASLPGCRD